MYFMSEAERRERLKVVGDYKHGSVCRLKLHNFLTYKDVECRPGPRLNMVVGPNGTGKSTILCAICLGLGGEPKLLGRASDIETFVMNGETQGSIEIELKNASINSSNPIIKRFITRDGTKSKKNSCFYLDGKLVTPKHIREMVLNDFGVSVDNLCTFLPQDRVGSFSGFNSQSLLIETEKSLSTSQHLYKTHLNLIEAQEELRSGHSNLENVKQKLAQLRTEHARLEREKERMEQRERAIEQSLMLKKKLVWLKFDASRTACLDARAAKQEAKKKMQAVQAELKPLEDLHMEAVEAHKTIRQEFSKKHDEIQSYRAELEKQLQKYENHDDKIEGIINEIGEIDERREQIRRKAQDTRNKLEVLQKEFEQFPPEEDIRNDYEHAKNERMAINPKLDAARRETRNAEVHVRDVEENFHHARAKFEKIKDDKVQRRERIFRQQPNLSNAFKWVDDNRSLFRKQVWGPIVCEVTTKSAIVANYLEHHVPNAMLKAFVVQSKEDYDLLYSKVRQEKRIPINIIIAKGDRGDAVPHRMYSEQRMEVLKRDHGVIGYMDEGFDAPDAVQQALRNAAQVHKVLIGTEKTQESLNNGLLEELSRNEADPNKKQGFSIFTCEGGRSYRYMGRVSNYGNRNLSTVIDDVKDARQLAPGVSEEKKQEIKSQFDECAKALEAARAAMTEAKTKTADVMEEGQQLHVALQTTKANLDNFFKHSGRIKNAERKLQEMEEMLQDDSMAEKSKKVSELRLRLANSISAMKFHGDCHSNLMSATYRCAGIRIQKDRAAADERHARQAKEDMDHDFKKAEREVHNAHRAYQESRRELESLKTKAEQDAPLYDGDGNELPLKAELEAIPMETIEEGEAALEEAEAKINEIVADPNVVRQYLRQQVQIEEMDQQVEQMQLSKNDKVKEMQHKKGPWQAALKNSVNKIDTKFSQYMSELGCQGEVALTEGEADGEEEEEGSFKDWGIEIRVSFRENTKPQVLSARVQSGGERSVSTIMYLMALQDMMVAPFRCVDEINQGLDERNERLVFRRIVENSTRKPGREGAMNHSGQYFLITPKLLPNLTDMEVEAMTVLCIFNGPFNFKNPQDWNIPKFLKQRQGGASSANKRRAPGTADDDDHDADEAEGDDDVDADADGEDEDEGEGEPRRGGSKHKKARTRR